MCNACSCCGHCERSSSDRKYIEAPPTGERWQVGLAVYAPNTNAGVQATPCHRVSDGNAHGKEVSALFPMTMLSRYLSGYQGDSTLLLAFPGYPQQGLYVRLPGAEIAHLVATRSRAGHPWEVSEHAQKPSAS